MDKFFIALTIFFIYFIPMLIVGQTLDTEARTNFCQNHGYEEPQYKNGESYCLKGVNGWLERQEIYCRIDGVRTLIFQPNTKCWLIKETIE